MKDKLNDLDLEFKQLEANLCNFNFYLIVIYLLLIDINIILFEE